MAILDTLEHAAQEAPLESIESCEAKIRAWAAAHPHDAEWGGGAGKVSWLIGRWGADNKFAIGGGVYVHVSKADGAVTVWGGPFHVGNVQVGAPWRDMHVRELAAALDASGL